MPPPLFLPHITPKSPPPFVAVELDNEITELDILLQNKMRAERNLEPIKREPRKAGPLFKVLWFRVVLDEASGNIRNPNTAAARACHKLAASRRWCLTGTPIENGIKDLYSLFKFLKFT